MVSDSSTAVLLQQPTRKAKSLHAGELSLISPGRVRLPSRTRSTACFQSMLMCRQGREGTAHLSAQEEHTMLGLVCHPFTAHAVHAALPVQQRSPARWSRLSKWHREVLADQQCSLTSHHRSS